MTAKPCAMVNWFGACRYLARFQRPQFADIASAREISGPTKDYGSKVISFEGRRMKAGFGIEKLGRRIGTCNRHRIRGAEYGEGVARAGVSHTDALHSR